MRRGRVARIGEVERDLDAHAVEPLALPLEAEQVDAADPGRVELQLVDRSVPTFQHQHGQAGADLGEEIAVEGAE